MLPEHYLFQDEKTPGNSRKIERRRVARVISNCRRRGPENSLLREFEREPRRDSIDQPSDRIAIARTIVDERQAGDESRRLVIATRTARVNRARTHAARHLVGQVL